MRFKPTVGGALSATLDFEFGGGVAPLSVPLSGDTPPDFSVDPATVEFAGTTSGYDSRFEDVTITSTGGTPLDLGTPVISGVDAAMFSIIDPTSCDATLSVTETCEIEVGFSPAASSGGFLEAQLSFTGSNDSSPATVQLEGDAIRSEFTVVPTGNDFGEAEIGLGINRPALDYAVVATGEAALPFNGASIAGPDASSFVITSPDCPASIAPQELCGVKVAFDPKSGPPGQRNATLVIDAFSSVVPGPTTISLTGTATVDPGPPPAGPIRPSAPRPVNPRSR